jgi:O-antigen ligase
MQSADLKEPSVRTIVALLGLTVLPVFVFVLLRYLGLQSLAKLGVLGLVVLGIGCVFFLRPKYGVYFMLLYVTSGLTFYLGSGVTAKGVMMLILAGLLFELLRGQSWRVNDQVFLWSAALFGIIALQSMLWAHELHLSVRYYTLFLKALLLVIFIVQVIRKPEDLKWYGRLIFIGGIGTICLGVLNFRLGVDKEISTFFGVPRFTGAHGNANFAAAFLTSIIPMGMFVVRIVKNPLVRALSVLGVLMVAVSVFATYSRAALFAFLFVALAILFREARSRKTYVTIFIILLGVILFTPRYYWLRAYTITQVMENVQQDWSLYLRVQAARESWEIFKEHPFTGVGLSNFSARSDDELFIRIGAHNSYLEILSGLGLFGLLAYLSIFYSAIRQCILGMRARWRKQDEWMRDFSYYVMIALISVLISGLTGNYEYTYMLWIPVAGALALANLRKERADL